MSVAVQLTYAMRRNSARSARNRGRADVADVLPHDARAIRRCTARYDSSRAVAAVAVNGVLGTTSGMKTPVRDGDTVAFVKARRRLSVCSPSNLLEGGEMSEIAGDTS